MKMYTEAILVDDNITDIMNLPCIRSCEKETWKRSARFVYTLDNGEKAYYGDWIVKGVDGVWEVRHTGHGEEEVGE